MGSSLGFRFVWKAAHLESPSRFVYIGLMDITLTADQEAWLRAEIAKGRFATPEDAITYAINEAKRTSLQETLNASIERGGANTADEVRRAITDRLKTAS
jgi:Arc/MetJ-type ribon-helix-helix transcriptional regulator